MYIFSMRNLTIMACLLFIVSVTCFSCEESITVDIELGLDEKHDSIVQYDGISYQLSKQQPISFWNHANSKVYDFGKDAFCQFEISVTGKDGDTLHVSYGECLMDGHVDMNPGQTRRFGQVSIPLREGHHTYKPHIKRIPYSDDKYAILMPKEIGEVVPLRFIEIKKCQNYADLVVSRVVVTCPFNDNASSFHCDNEMLNRIWDFCKYSIKATSSFGYYIDGDRERRPYEADALINMLGHYAVDSYYDIGRRTCQYLIDKPTWPTEWILQTVIIAWNNYLFSGDKSLLIRNYEILKAHTLIELIDSSVGLVTTKKGQSNEFLSSINLKNEMSDIVDWPHSDDPEFIDSDFNGEDDGFVYTDFNTVVNAFHYKAVTLMAKIANVTGHKNDAIWFQRYSDKFKQVFNESFFDAQRGVYVDGIGTNHSSLHANMFPMAFDLVPEENIQKVADFIVSRGLACSVYGSQFLLEALYKAGRSDVALDYMTSEDDRSWYNMMREGATISMEAWGNKFKPNQDWNHAWGAAPANIIPFNLVGVYPLTPGAGGG